MNYIMNKEFVTYEIALALKELGFNEECLGKYIPYFSKEGWILSLDAEKIYLTNNLLRQGFSAPLKQQVFRWFREKYNQNSFIELVYQDRIKYDYVLYVNKKEEECENYGDGPFITYEEAENACIDKLIEIVKQQDNG